MAVQFGLAMRNFVGPGETPDVDELLAYAQRAEELGYESLWVWDHMLLGVDPAFPVLDALSILIAIAARTTRIKLGTGVLVLPLRNPVVTAKTLTSLDQISKGRLIVGAAAGWYAREFDAVGVEFKRRGRIFERNLDLMLRLWTEDSVTLQVDNHNLRQAVLLPKPYQVAPSSRADRGLRRRGAAPRGPNGGRLADLLLHAGRLHQILGQGTCLR
jgi:alkanesulfonate monooxygenase